MQGPSILDQFHRRARGEALPLVVDDRVEVRDGAYAARHGVVDDLAYAENPMQFLVDFLDGTDEYFPASALTLLDPLPNER